MDELKPQQLDLIVINNTLSIVIKPPDVMDIAKFDTVAECGCDFSCPFIQICIQADTLICRMNETFQDSLLAVDPKQRL